MCNFRIRSGKPKGTKSILSFFQTLLNACLGNMLSQYIFFIGTTCQKKNLCLADHIKFNFSLYSTGRLLMSVFGKSLSAEGKWQIGGFHSPVPSLQSFFHRETWGFAMLCKLSKTTIAAIIVILRPLDLIFF